jgi:hypothetical protein
MTKLPPWTLQPSVDPVASRARGAVADVLHGASALLARLAQRLHVAEREAPADEPALEFYAEAGAPEGALYLNGRLVGVLQGVTRL